MTDADLDRILRAADPAAHRAAPAPGLLPVTTAPPRPPRRWVPIASAAAVVAVVGAAVAVLPSMDRDRGGIRAGAPGASVPAPSVPVDPSAAATSGPAKPQREHTMAAGAEFERARRLLGTLQAAVPARYDLPTGPVGHPAGTAAPTIGPGGQRLPAANFQAVRDEGPYEGYTGFVYDADTTVADGPRVGAVRVSVYEGVPLNEPCAVAKTVAWNEGTCRVVSTKAGSVALVDATAPADPRDGQWAVFQRSDGTVVLVAQGRGVLNEAVPALRAPVWTAAQLAEVATDPAFTR